MAKSTTKTAGQRITAAEKKTMAVQLREAGLTFQQISEQVGCSVSRAHQYVENELDRLNEKASESAETLRRLEAERLDRATTGIWSHVKRGDYKAIDRLIKIMERRAKLFGLDGPTKLATTDPEGNEAPARVVLVPAPAGSVEEWVQQVRDEKKDE